MTDKSVHDATEEWVRHSITKEFAPIDINDVYKAFAAGAQWQSQQAQVPEGLRDSLFSGWRGCSNHDCIVTGPKRGMGTNGSCSCLHDASRAQLHMLKSRLQTLLTASPCPPAKVETKPAYRCHACKAEAPPPEAFNIVEGIRAETTWGGWRSAYSRDWVMNRLSERLSMLTASPAPEHSGDGNEMVGWISVNEQTPSQGERVLLKIDLEDCPVVGYWGCGRYEACTVNMEVSCGAFCYGGNVDSNFSREEVTHWMPLPNPPQQEETER